jgi:hypothetical protein
LAAEHTRIRCIPFGSDLRPKEDAQADSGENGHTEEKNGDLHNLLRGMHHGASAVVAGESIGADD